MDTYHPETYWSKVASRIKSRQGQNVIAGDDEPYYRYKRQRFLKMLSSIAFTGHSVLEIGHGPGGNLDFINRNFSPRFLAGVDISQNMVDLAKELLPASIEVQKVNGTTLPFANDSFDIVFSATVLQHNTDEIMLNSLVQEMCRVARKKIYIFERINDPIAGDDLCLGRPVRYYADLFGKSGFQLGEVEFINIHASYLTSGAIRKGLNSSTRQEGEPLNKLSVSLQNIILPVSKQIDKLWTKAQDLAKLEFLHGDSV